ncbi:hypothetical protein ACVXG8_11590 [Escherichia coli]
MVLRWSDGGSGRSGYVADGSVFRDVSLLRETERTNQRFHVATHFNDGFGRAGAGSRSSDVWRAARCAAGDGFFVAG